MPTTLTALGCNVTANAITIIFSEPVDGTTATIAANYTIYDPPTITTPTSPATLQWAAPTVSSDGLSVTLTPATALTPGDFLLIGISGVIAVSGSQIPPTDISGQVPITGGAGRAVRDVEDAISYPILTEEISNRPFPVSTIPGGGGAIGGGGSSSLGQLASRAVTDVLGWKLNPADPKGFVGALTQAFTLSDVEGHVEATWNPQMAAIQTDLGGSITGAQASLYMRAKDAINQSSSLLDTLYPLDPEADPEYVRALREMVRSQMTQIVREFAVVGLPSVLRIDTYFSILLDQSPALISTGEITFDPDEVGGTLGKLRDTYGIQFAGNPFNNSVADEVVITNFRVISDYLTSLLQSWISNRTFFFVLPNRPAFFGTQLVLISRQFNVIAETVNELRFTLDSVFIGPAERQALLIEFSDPTLPPRFLEGMLIEIEAFVGDEGPRLLKEGGKITVTNNILPVVRSLLNMVDEAHSPTNIDELPDGFRTARVRNSLDDLQDQLERLVELVEQVEQGVPASEFKLSVSGVSVDGPDDSDLLTLTVFGEGFEPGIAATINSTAPVAVPQSDVTFYSAQRVDIDIDLSTFSLANGSHDITLTNPSGDTLTVEDAFTLGNGPVAAGVVQRQAFSNPAFRLRASSSKTGGVKKTPVRPKATRQFVVNTGAGQKQSKGSITQRPAPPAPPASSLQAQKLEAAQKDLANKVNDHSQHLADLNQKMESKFEQVMSALHEHTKTLHEKLAELTGRGQQQPAETPQQPPQEP